MDTIADLQAYLMGRAAAALELEDAEGIRLTEPPSAEQGDLALGCHPLARTLRRPPQDIAVDLAKALADDPWCRSAEALSGFVNLRLDRRQLLRMVTQEVTSDPARFGCARGLAAEKWLIEFSGPNTNKPLHIGHLRNTILGVALSNIVELHGHRVLRYNIVNDRGIHICKSMVAYARFGDQLTPEAAGQKGDQFVGQFYSMFAARAAEEFGRWIQAEGQARFEAFQAKQSASLEAAADLQLRRTFLQAEQSQGTGLPFQPRKVKAARYPELMREVPDLEARYQTWKSGQDAALRETMQREAQKRFQAAEARTFEAEHSELQAAAREYLARWEQADPEIRALWRRMNDWVLAGLEQTYQRLGVRFDAVDYESDVYLLGKEHAQRLLEQKVARRLPDGAIVFPMPGTSADEPEQEKVLLRADGTSVYITQDIGSLLRRVERHAPDRLIWVVGSEQELHFQTLFQIVEQLQPGLGARCEHLSYGMVELPHGKMKSREGEIVEADSFLDDVHAAAYRGVAEREEADAPADEADLHQRAETMAMAAVKFHLLKWNKRSLVKFDVDDALNHQGKTGTYCLYALARIRSIHRKLVAEGEPVAIDGDADGNLLADSEMELLLAAARWPQAVQQAVRDLEPYHVTDYAHKLAKLFNSYFNARDAEGRTLFPVVDCADSATKRARIGLIGIVASALENALNCLGIRTLERI